MRDNFCYVKCIDGHCPLIIEDERYGGRFSTCDDYCNPRFCTCDTCAFLGDSICDDCIYNHYADKSDYYDVEFNKYY